MRHWFPVQKEETGPVIRTKDRFMSVISYSYLLSLLVPHAVHAATVIHSFRYNVVQVDVTRILLAICQNRVDLFTKAQQ